MAPASPGHGYFLGSGTRWTAAVAFCAIYAPTRPPSTAQVPTLTPRRRQVQHPPAGQMLEQEISTHVPGPEVAPVWIRCPRRPCSQAHGGGYFMEEDEETIPRSILEILRNLIRSAPLTPPLPESLTKF